MLTGTGRSSLLDAHCFSTLGTRCVSGKARKTSVEICAGGVGILIREPLLPARLCQINKVRKTPSPVQAVRFKLSTLFALSLLTASSILSAYFVRNSSTTAGSLYTGPFVSKRWPWYGGALGAAACWPPPPEQAQSASTAAAAADAAMDAMLSPGSASTTAVRAGS